MELERFFLGSYETALKTGEVLVDVYVPAPQRASAGCHFKFTIGSPENKPVANASVVVRLDTSTQRCVEACVVIGAVGAVPLLSASAAAVLEGEHLDDTLIAEAAKRASEECDPVDDIRGSAWYKRRITRVLVERGLKCALQKVKARNDSK